MDTKNIYIIVAVEFDALLVSRSYILINTIVDLYITSTKQITIILTKQ